MATLCCGVLTLADRAASAPLPLGRDEGLLSEVHKRYAGKVVFSKTFIPRSLLSDAAFRTSFGIGDPIFMRPLLKESLSNAMKRAGIDCAGERNGQLVQVQVDADTPDKWTEIYNEEFGDKNFEEDTTMLWWKADDEAHANEPFWGVPTVYEKSANLARFQLAAVFSRLTPGTHKLTLHHQAWCSGGHPKPEVATGELTLSFTAAEQTAAIRRFGPAFPVSKNPEARVLAPIYKTEVAREVTGTVRQVALPWNEWSYKTNDITGVYTERRGTFVVGYERSPGQCFVTEPTAQHPATDGRNKRFAPRPSGFFTGESWPFPCQALTGR